MTEREALTLALEALETGKPMFDAYWGGSQFDNAITAIKEALAEPEREPAACQHKRYSVDVHEQIGNCLDCGAEGQMRFIVGNTIPPQRTWVGLDNDDLVWIYSNSDKVGQAISNTEAKLKEKNT